MLQVARESEEEQHTARAGVVHSQVADADLKVVGDDGGAFVPAQDFGAEAVVGKAFGRVGEYVAALFEVHVVLFCYLSVLGR